ncbi:MAG: FecR family protein [Syntrophobacterales bacterium]|jgi:hypothetical protein|nr:FecR family protein [Syntrophobacterales bacterium]
MVTSHKSLWWWLTLGCCLVSFLAASRTAPAQERKPAAELIALTGKAEIKSSGETKFRPANLQDKLYPQDQVRTLADSRAKLFFQDESILILSEDTTLDISKFQMNSQGQRESSLIKMLHGSLRFIVQKVTAGAPANFEIQGQTAIMGIRGTDGVYESRSPDQITFLSGNNVIIIRNLTTGQTISLTQNNFVIATPGQPMRTGTVTPRMRQQILRHYQVAQIFTPTAVTSPGPPPAAVMTALQRSGTTFLGEPQYPNSNQGRDNFSPGAQGNGVGAPAIPLSALHQPLIPRK